MTRRTPKPPRAPSPPDWYAVGRALRAEVGAMTPRAFATLVRERWPTIDGESAYRLGVGYATGAPGTLPREGSRG